MTAPRATCPKCGSEFLQSTADANSGFCRKCKRSGAWGSKFDSAVEGVALSLRLILAFVFMVIFAGLGYGAGAVIWTGIGVVLALVFAPIGFVYGFFCAEINLWIRTLFRLLLPLGGD